MQRFRGETGGSIKTMAGVRKTILILFFKVFILLCHYISAKMPIFKNEYEGVGKPVSD